MASDKPQSALDGGVIVYMAKIGRFRDVITRVLVPQALNCEYLTPRTHESPPGLGGSDLTR